MGLAVGPRLCNPGGVHRLRRGGQPGLSHLFQFSVILAHENRQIPIAFLTAVVTWGGRWQRGGGWEAGGFPLFIGLIVRAAKWHNKGKSVPLPESHPDRPGVCLGVCDQNVGSGFVTRMWVPLSSVPSGYPQTVPWPSKQLPCSSLPHPPHKALESFLTLHFCIRRRVPSSYLG